MANFLREFQDILPNNIPGEMPPSKGKDNHSIDSIPGCTWPNNLPSKVSQALQEDIMQQEDELVTKGMIRTSSSPFYFINALSP